MALWCNWLTRRPLKAKSPGSSPGNATKMNNFEMDIGSVRAHEVHAVCPCEEDARLVLHRPRSESVEA